MKKKTTTFTNVAFKDGRCVKNMVRKSSLTNVNRPNYLT